MKLSMNSLTGNPWGSQNPNSGEITASTLASLGLMVNLGLRPQTWAARVRLRRPRIGIVIKRFRIRVQSVQDRMYNDRCKPHDWSIKSDSRPLFVDVSSSFQTLKAPKPVHKPQILNSSVGKAPSAWLLLHKRGDQGP